MVIEYRVKSFFYYVELNVTILTDKSLCLFKVKSFDFL
jgi:hypothetical protein